MHRDPEERGGDQEVVEEAVCHLWWFPNNLQKFQVAWQLATDKIKSRVLIWHNFFIHKSILSINFDMSFFSDFQPKMKNHLAKVVFGEK